MRYTTPILRSYAVRCISVFLCAFEIDVVEMGASDEGLYFFETRNEESF
jgi:hypothetical protein